MEARSKPEISPLSSSLRVTWKCFVTSLALLIFYSWSFTSFAALASIFSSSKTGKIYSLVIRAWILPKNDILESLNLLISMLGPSLLGPKHAVLSLIYLMSFWLVLCSLRLSKKPRTKAFTFLSFRGWNFSIDCYCDNSKESRSPLRFFSIHLTISKSRPTALILTFTSLLEVDSWAHP